MRYFNKKIFYAALIAVVCFFYFDGPDRIFTWYTQHYSSPYLQSQSLYPEITRALSIRFDPSYYYEQQKHPSTLAKELAEKWYDNGVNLVFFRAYDPRYGAFYKTRYVYNQTGEYGKYDLLGKVVKECHSRNIKVFSWFPFLNHAGAWKKHTSWRVKTAEGVDYSTRGLEYPLNPGNEEVRRWWQGFLSDFLDRYPDIDGVDFGEPVVSWGGKQKVSDIQAASLTRLIGDSTAIVHQKRKKVCITTAQTASPSGDLLLPDEFREITGFDLSGVLKAEKHRTPDIICPEFIWQELRSRHEAGKDTKVFAPAWTEKVVRQFMQWVESPVEIITHVELTDFPNVTVNGSQLKKTFQAAIRGGAVGLDVYSSHELDKKDAWSVIREARNMAGTKSCLVLYDQAGGKNDAIQAGELLRHFNTDVTLMPLDEYKKGTLERYHAVFYLGTVSGATLPDHFLSDLLKGGRTFCWLGSNIDGALNRREVSRALGIKYVGAAKDRYRSVAYKGHTLVNENPWINVIQVVDPVKCSTLATALGGETNIPYAVRCGQNFWYFADVPSSHAVEGGRFLVFADLLHDILNENHETHHLAMVRIEDVHPLSNPEALKEIAAFLHRQNVPFQISLVPFYVFPEQNIYVSLNEKPEFIEAIKYMVRKGGSVVMHGVTHQRFGETTSDYEFWDPVKDQPPEGTNAATIREKIEKGLRACWSAGIYPLMWETPHYAGSQELYSIVKDYFSIAMERRQAIDHVGTDQYLPYLVPHDRHGQTIVPENLGYVPLDRQDPNVILEPARHTKVVRDGVASFFFHPFVQINVLKTIVKRMKKEGFEFTTIGDLPIRVQTPFGLMTNFSGDVGSAREGFNGLEARGVFPGIMAESKKVEVDAGDTYPRSIRLKKGELYFVHFMTQVVGTSEDEVSSETEKTKDLLLTVPNFYGEHRQVPRPLLIEPLKKHSGAKHEFQAIKDLFSLVGIPVAILNVSKLTHIPARNNIVIIPSASAVEMTDDAVANTISALRKGEISLFTSGISKLSDELGIEKKDSELVIGSVRDTYYPNIKVQWDPPVSLQAFDAPATASFIYEDELTGNPLCISADLDRGKFLYLGVPCADSNISCFWRYPYILTHFFRSMGVFPLVRRAAAEVYYNPSEREDIPIETLVKEWRRVGIRVIYTAAWQVYPEWTYDYGRLIRLAHTNGMLVYAWFELPHMNDKLWMAHPEWREKNALGKDAEVGWHKPMALVDKDCFKAILQDIEFLLDRFDWDGVMLNRVGWESENGIKQPETYTPFHAAVQNSFEAAHGFNPLSLMDPDSIYYWRTNAGALHQFEKWRARRAEEILKQVLAMLFTMKKQGREYWEIILTYDTNQIWNGLSLQDMTDLKQQFDVLLQLTPISDRQWRDFPESIDMVQIFIGPNKIGKPFYPGAPTAYPTGTALYTLLGDLINSHKRFSIFSENALYDVDRQILPFLFAGDTQLIWTEKGLRVQTPLSAEIVFARNDSSPILMDNNTTGSALINSIIVPAGDHFISNGNRFNKFLSLTQSTARLVDCSANLLNTNITSLGLDATYRAERRTVMIVNEKPLGVRIDGVKTSIQMEKGITGWALMLPKGKHVITIQTRGIPQLSIMLFSLALSNTIVVMSFFAILTFLLIGLTLVVGRKLKGADKS